MRGRRDLGHPDAYAGRHKRAALYCQCVSDMNIGTQSDTNSDFVSELFDASAWQPVDGLRLTDVTYHRALAHGTVRVAINRPEVRNAFRPRTVDDLYAALDHARQSPDVGCVLLTGNGPSPKDGGWAFSSGGDQRVRGKAGYEYPVGLSDEPMAVEHGPVPEGLGEQGQSGAADRARLGRLHILEVQRLIRFMPKVVIAVVPGWAVGGGHSLHVVCDLTLASDEHARFRQTDADVASFDGGFGSAYLARQVGQKRAREVFFLGRSYDAREAYAMGMVNAVVPHASLETVALEWAAAVNAKSPTSVRMLKYAFNMVDDGLIGQQVFAGEATRLAYMTEEAAEGRDAFLERREPDWSPYPWHY
jgi:naphthoate synthase